VLISLNMSLALTLREGTRARGSVGMSEKSRFWLLSGSWWPASRFTNDWGGWFRLGPTEVGLNHNPDQELGRLKSAPPDDCLGPA
jgi:hypothetical protein